MKKTFPNKPQPAPASSPAPGNRPNATNAAPAIHQKSSHNNSRQHQFNPSQFNATASVDPENRQFPKTLFALLQVILVSLLNGDKVFDTYALIDPGSRGTYVLDSISHSLELETGHQFDLDVQFMNLSRSFSVRLTAFKIGPYADNETQFEIKNAYTTACLNIPPANISDLNGICQSNSTLRHIKFLDIDKRRIGVLLGTSCVQFTHALEWIRGSPTRPAGLRTELRWTIAGEFMHRRRTKLSFRKNFVLIAATEIHRNAADQFPPDMLEQYWSIKKTASEPAESFVFSDVDNEALQILEKTCRHNGERYEIGHPWKSDVNLPNNYYAALNRVRSLEKRLTRNHELKNKFDETLTTDLQKQYVTPVVMQNPPPEKIWYLPTHPVDNRNKPGKVRRVANAASKYKNESLNSNLLAGPDLLANLLELFLRFREHAVGVLADIEGMFMQIAIRPEDQSALRFLWMSDNYVLQYQYIRLIFGANCSPFCAIFVLRLCAQDLASQFPDVLQAVLNNFYMDDFIQSFSTAAAARQLTNDLRTVLQRGCFRLTKFISNNSDALSFIPAEDREKSASETTVLGQTWCLCTDSYTAPPPKSVDNQTTVQPGFINSTRSVYYHR